ncbi:MAG: glycosyltransferase family 2 protein [Planctomycetota bacterium]
MPADEPLLSVVTPVLNGGRFFDGCLRSVERLASNVPGMVEHIIADGGSTDGTLERAKRSRDAAASPISAVIEGPDRGQSHAINRGFRAARGQWFSWLNADDRFMPDAAAAVSRLAEESSGKCDVLVGRCDFADETGSVVFAPERPDLSDARDLLLPLSRWFAGSCIVQPEAFIRSRAFDSVGGLVESNHFAMDHDLWLRLLEHGAIFRTMPELVARQVVHDGQKTADNAEVAREILHNCERSLQRQSTCKEDTSEEIAELRDRLADLGTIMGSRRGRPPVGSRAVVSSIAGVLMTLPAAPLAVLAIGRHTEEAARLSGRDRDRITRASGPLGAKAVFDVIVVDALSFHFDDDSLFALAREMRSEGRLIVAGCVPPGGAERILRNIAHTLGVRVTSKGRPWSPEVRQLAIDLAGWARSCSRMPRDLPRELSVVQQRHAPVEPWAKMLLPVLGLDSSDIAQTQVLARRSSGRVR